MRNKAVRVSLALVAMAAMVGLSGCWWGYGSYYYYWGGGNGNGNGNALWVANGTNVVEFSPSQLTNGVSDPVPRRTISSIVFGAPQGVVFDSYGDLWVIDGGTVASDGSVAPALYEFTAKQLSNLSSNSAPTPAVTISSTSFVFPQQAAFDGRGNLWVTDNGSNAVYVLTAKQLSATATVTPGVSLTSTPTFNGPLGITFDYRGNLWVANNATTTIFGFNASSLPVVNPSTTTATSSALTPSVTLSDNGSGSIQAPWALAIDGSGDLWSSNANAPNTVVEFKASQITATGSPTPNITLASATVSNNATLVAPNGIGFDNYGDLAVMSSAAPFGMAGYGPGQLRTNPTSPLTPAVFLVGGSTTLNAPAGVTFGPTY
jgi:sugar lactone lactonase YvrE